LFNREVRMKHKNKGIVNKYTVGIGIVIILIILSVIFVPKGLDALKTKYRVEGYNICINNVVTGIMKDINEKGYTELRVGDQVIKLGVIE